jgi:2-aminobenzoate-CoA ligase
VAECAVIGVADEARGQIVEAHVVLVAGQTGDALMVKILQDHVKATIAPYKYPRSVVFAEALPKTETGKIQRFRLRSRRGRHRKTRTHDHDRSSQSAGLGEAQGLRERDAG